MGAGQITQLDTGLDQAAAKKIAGDLFTDGTEKAIAAVDSAEEATLGLMMKTNQDLNNLEIQKQTREAGPGNLGKDLKKAAGEVKSGG